MNNNPADKKNRTKKRPDQTDQGFDKDPRLPSGEWSGFYLENHQPRRGWMHLYINFQNCQIQAEGTDYVGPWTSRGTYNIATSVCQWTKQYQGKHRVEYEGKITESGIRGIWKIRNWTEGPFHIWPNARTDLQQLYMEDDLQQIGPSMLLGGDSQADGPI